MAQAPSATLAANILRLRKDRRLRQHELAKQIGCSQANLSQIEHGHSLPSLDLIFAIAQALDVPPHQLLLSPEDEESELTRQSRRIAREIQSLKPKDCQLILDLVARLVNLQNTQAKLKCSAHATKKK